MLAYLLAVFAVLAELFVFACLLAVPFVMLASLISETRKTSLACQYVDWEPGVLTVGLQHSNWKPRVMILGSRHMSYRVTNLDAK